MKDVLNNLMKVKSIVTIVVLGVFAYLAVTGAIDATQVMAIVTTVIAFYFGTQHQKNGG